MDADRLLLTPQEAAWRLSVAESTLRLLTATGVIESVRIGRSRRIPLDALTDYIDRLREEQGQGS